MLPQDPRAKANLLLVEIGNSHISLAVEIDGKLGAVERLDAVHEDVPTEALSRCWGTLPARRLRAAVLASVVPAATARLRTALAGDLRATVAEVGVEVPAPIEIAVAFPKSVGIDRLCGAAAAYDVIQAPCAVASFGTATTIDCVDGTGRFRGGAILPGLGTQAWSLHQRTAQLPEISLSAPVSVYGGDTAAAITNGIVYGAAGALREIVERYATDLGRWPQLVITGGYAPLMSEMCDFVDSIVPDLVMRGMILAYRRSFAE